MNIQQIIEKEVENLMEKSDKFVPFQKIHYQSALEDLRAKAPKIEKKIVEEIEKILAFAYISDDLAGGYAVRVDDIEEIIKNLTS